MPDYKGSAVAHPKRQEARPKRVGGQLPRLLIHDPALAVWLMCDGRAVRDDHSRVHLQLTEAHLPGLNDIDAEDAVALGVYLTAFKQMLTEAGYRWEIVPVSQPAKSAGASGRTRKENAG